MISSQCWTTVVCDWLFPLILYWQAWRCRHSAYICFDKESLLRSLESVSFSFFPVGRAFLVLRELEQLGSRLRDVAAEIELRSRVVFPC